MKVQIKYDCDTDRDIRQQCVAEASVPLNVNAGVSRILRGYGSTYQAARAQLLGQLKLYLQKPADEEIEL